MLEAIFFGVIQGLTEFLPVSSSAHIRIFGEFFGLSEDPGARFTAIMQIGTELAVLIYFRKDIAKIVSAWFRQTILRRSLDIDESGYARMGWLIIIGSIPIMVLGYLGQDLIRSNFRSLWLIASVLIIFGIVLWLADRFGKSDKSLKDLSISNGLLYGLAQSLALIPGVSRSGATIAMGRALGYSRDAALRYSFLLAIPAVFASGLYELKGAIVESGQPNVFNMTQTLAATAVAFVVGYLVIAWLIKFISKASFMPFVIYRVALGATVLALLTAGVIQSSASELTPAPVKSISYQVPSDCMQTKVLAALVKDVRQAQFIDTPWAPAEGTELADFLNNGGLACSYGMQSAEIGITVKWLKDSGSLFNARVNSWLSEGFEKVDIPDLDESAAYFHHERQSPTNELHIYMVNFSVDGIWIQLSSTFGNTIEDGSGWIKAAVDSL